MSTVLASSFQSTEAPSASETRRTGIRVRPSLILGGGDASSCRPSTTSLTSPAAGTGDAVHNKKASVKRNTAADRRLEKSRFKRISISPNFTYFTIEFFPILFDVWKRKKVRPIFRFYDKAGPRQRQEMYLAKDV
jgi:hypothetical protein